MTTPDIRDAGNLALMIVNAGAGDIHHEGWGWTNTYAEARTHAEDWLNTMIHTEGFADIEMADDIVESGGTWKFVFRHKITGVEVLLWMHGVDDLAAYRRQKLSDPRVYWNDSSCASPTIGDFAADGFVPVMTYRRADRKSES